MTLQEFYDLLARHDWSFNYSDDHRQWQRGHDQLNQIQHILKQNEDNPSYSSLYDHYRDWAFDALGDVTKPEKPE
jgi:hypothetical protein